MLRGGVGWPATRFLMKHFKMWLLLHGSCFQLPTKILFDMPGIFHLICHKFKRHPIQSWIIDYENISRPSYFAMEHPFTSLAILSDPPFSCVIRRIKQRLQCFAPCHFLATLVMSSPYNARFEIGNQWQWSTLKIFICKSKGQPRVFGSHFQHN